MHFHTALRAFLLSRLFGHGLLLCFGFPLCHELLFTRRIGLLHGALRMDATHGVRPLSTNRTDLLVVFTKDWSGLLRVFFRHVPFVNGGEGLAPKIGKCFSVAFRSAKLWAAVNSTFFRCCMAYRPCTKGYGRHHENLANCSAALRNAWLWLRNTTCKTIHEDTR